MKVKFFRSIMSPKKLLLSITLLFSILISDAQSKDSNGSGIYLDDLFTGGTANMSFGENSATVGISPCFGISLTKYVEVAVNVNVNYATQRNIGPYNIGKLRQMVFGPGAFIRLFPAKFFFLQAQYERNVMQTKYYDIIDDSYNISANSLLVGAGIASGKNYPEKKSYYYFSVLWDVLKSTNSPYLDNTKTPVPIIRAGYNISLFNNRY